MSKIIESGLWLLRSIAVCLFWADIASFESSWVAVQKDQKIKNEQSAGSEL